MRGLAAAGDVIRESGFALEHLEIAQRVTAPLDPSDWRARAAEIVRRAEGAAFAACSPEPAPPGARLIFELRSFEHD